MASTFKYEFGRTVISFLPKNGFSENEDNTDVIDFNAEVINVTDTGDDYTMKAVDEGFFRNQGLSFLYQSQIQVVSY